MFKTLTESLKDKARQMGLKKAVNKNANSRIKNISLQQKRKKSSS